MEPPEPTPLLLGLLPVAFGAAFAACSAVLTAVPHSRQAALLETLSGARRAALARFMSSEHRVRARWLVWQAFALTLSPSLLAHQGRSLLVSIAAPAAVFVLITLMLRAASTANPETFSSRLLTFLAPLDSLLIPVVDPLVKALAPLARLFPAKGGRAELTGSEVGILVNEGEQRGALDHEQSEMIRNVLEFGEIEAGELMVPRTQVTAIEVGTPAEELLRLVAQSEHSRYPVYREKIDNIIGILHLKDVFLFMSRSSSSELVVEQLLRKAAFVPETQSASVVLQEMRAGRHHMSIVIDEYGGMSGIVTLEDLLEEIVGDIRDEYDDEDPPIVTLKNGNILVDASVPISELEREVGIELPDNGEYNSVGGFVVDELGCVPEPGTAFVHDGFRFTVKTADDRRVSKIEISRLLLQAAG